MEKVDTTAYSTAKITGDYAFGVAGLDHLNNRRHCGPITSNGTGALTNPLGRQRLWHRLFDDLYGSELHGVNTATGRGTMNLAFTFGGTPDSLNFVFYHREFRKAVCDGE